MGFQTYKKTYVKRIYVLYVKYVKYRQRDIYTDLPSRPTVRRRVAASLRHVGVFFLHSFHRHLGAELDQQTPH